MNTDRELLELAAKAAGLSGDWTETIGGWPALAINGSVTSQPWQPQNDDGDGARLEAALGLDVIWHDADGHVTVRHAEHGFHAAQRYDWHSGDKQAARRMATLRCAAAMGSEQSQSPGSAEGNTNA